ncbi:MAG: creatininase family protein, partial [Candidatus Binatia bacterium]
RRRLMSWRAAHNGLITRVRALPPLVQAALAADGASPAVGLATVRRVVATGIGSSAAHARYLAWLLAEYVGCDARFRPLGAFFEPAPAGSCDDLLVVVSQGLAPNARVALADLAAWRHVVVLTATDGDEARRRGRTDAAELVEHLAAVGVELRTFAGAEEYGTLVRVTGPMMGYAAVLRYARDLAATVGRATAIPLCDGAHVAAAMTAMAASVEPLRALATSGRLAGPVALLASGDYAGLVDNLRAKLLEGIFVPLPPAFDLLELAHGPFQQAFPAEATFLALTRPDAAREVDLLARFTTMLDPARHRVVPLAATLPLPFSIFEHETAMNELMLAGIAARAVDQARWPGQGRDGPLYSVGSPDRETLAASAEDDALPRSGARRLADLTWPEVEAALAAAPCIALVPLGATEQHGPHLAFAADTWIGDALAERLAVRLPETIVCPTLAFGCSREHLGFPGTLDLQPATLAAVLGDVLASLARHGFAGAFVFSAHGGNYAELAAMLPALAATAAPMPVFAFTDLTRVSDALARVAAEHGIAPAAAGHHAGEVETSILMALRPDAVRGARLAAGHTEVVADPQTLFYPSLRTHASSGVVGDPRPASATRAAAYLDAWADVLVDAYRRAKNNPYANGTQNA